MPKCILKLNDGETDWYMEWSTIVDAPVSWGMKLDEFKEYYKEEYGKRGMRELQERLDRVEKYGTSYHEPTSAEDEFSYNRAGDNEKELTKEQIIEKYCLRE